MKIVLFETFSKQFLMVRRNFSVQFLAKMFWILCMKIFPPRCEYFYFKFNKIVLDKDDPENCE